ncbi:hypothetical protein QQ045_008737 [Rhodiola kirilowii]
MCPRSFGLRPKLKPVKQDEKKKNGTSLLRLASTSSVIESGVAWHWQARTERFQLKSNCFRWKVPIFAAAADPHPSSAMTTQKPWSVPHAESSKNSTNLKLKSAA